MDTDLTIEQRYICALRQLPQYLLRSVAYLGQFAAKHETSNLLITPASDASHLGDLTIHYPNGHQIQVAGDEFLKRQIWEAARHNVMRMHDFSDNIFEHCDADSEHIAGEMFEEANRLVECLNSRYSLNLISDW